MKIQRKITQIKNILTEAEIRFQDPEDETCLSYYLVGIDDVRVELEEPLKTEFENIFNASNWQNVQLKIN